MSHCAAAGEASERWRTAQFWIWCVGATSQSLDTPFHTIYLFIFFYTADGKDINMLFMKGCCFEELVTISVFSHSHLHSVNVYFA